MQIADGPFRLFFVEFVIEVRCESPSPISTELERLTCHWRKKTSEVQGIMSGRVDVELLCMHSSRRLDNYPVSAAVEIIIK